MPPSGTLNDENVITKYTTLLTWVWFIFGAIQLRCPNFPSPPAPLPKERGVFKQFLSIRNPACQKSRLLKNEQLRRGRSGSEPRFVTQRRLSGTE